MDRKLYLHLQAGREVSGVLRGFDMFLNLVVDQAHEELGGGQRKPLGMIVSGTPGCVKAKGWCRMGEDRMPR